MDKWRGIKTKQIKINELQPLTVINRFKQKTISLPRIDDKKRWAGYPGITGISRKLAKILPIFITYVEPFAGTAKVFQEVIKFDGSDWQEHYVLNDKSKFVISWLKKEFGHRKNLKITCTDFISCMKKFDSRYTLFVIDPPWHKSYYDQAFSYFDRNNVKEYDAEVIELCSRLQGKFVITTRKENKIMRDGAKKYGFKNHLMTSEYVVSGKYPKVLLTTNIEFTSRIR